MHILRESKTLQVLKVIPRENVPYVNVVIRDEEDDTCTSYFCSASTDAYGYQELVNGYTLLQGKFYTFYVMGTGVTTYVDKESYDTGDQVYFLDGVYESLIDDNTLSPAQSGSQWEELPLAECATELIQTGITYRGRIFCTNFSEDYDKYKMITYTTGSNDTIILI